MSSQRTPRWDREITLVSQLAAAASLLSFLFYFRHGDLLLYGDAVAHLNIARRVIDSRTPGLLQLGTVWLPLPHLLMIPFVLSDAAWQTGIAGAIPSMCAYVLGTVGIFRLVRGGLSCCEQTRGKEPLPAGTTALHNETRAEGPAPHARAAAWLAAAMYAANPNLLYMQTTAMTEVLYLTLFIWSVVHFSEFVRGADSQGQNGEHGRSSLMKCGWCTAGACLTRYDGWFLAMLLCLAAWWVIIRSKRSELRSALGNFVLLATAGPVLWMGYNAIVYRNPLEFANGPYSARAIEQQQQTALSHSSPHPGWHNLPVSFSYFLKASEDNVAEGKPQKLWLVLTGVGIIVAFNKRLWPFLLLPVPLVFYSLSIAYGSVPIYLPDWWPFSYYNVRFGLELLPAFAAMTALTVHFLLSLGLGDGLGKFGPQGPKPAVTSVQAGATKPVTERAGLSTSGAKAPAHIERLIAALQRCATQNRTISAVLRRDWGRLGPEVGLGTIVFCALILIGASYGLEWKAQPICYREAWINSRTRIAFETALAATLIKLPHDSSLLMYLGDHVGALQDAGIPLSRTINEGNHRPWKRPSDPEGLWERALVDPHKYADYVIAIGDDPIGSQVQRRNLTSMVVVHTVGQPPATIYWTHHASGNQAR